MTSLHPQAGIGPVEYAAWAAQLPALTRLPAAHSIRLPGNASFVYDPSDVSGWQSCRASRSCNLMEYRTVSFSPAKKMLSLCACACACACTFRLFFGFHPLHAIIRMCRVQTCFFFWHLHFTRNSFVWTPPPPLLDHLKALLTVPLTKKQLHAHAVEKSKEVVSIRSFMLTENQMKQNQYPMKPSTATASGGGPAAAAGPAILAQEDAGAAASGGGGGGGGAAGDSGSSVATAGSPAALASVPTTASTASRRVIASWMLDDADSIALPDAVANPRPLYAIDCEMVRTSEGLELARTSVLDEKGATLLDILCKPANEVVDYLTRFSGITEELLKGVETRLSDVQAKIKEIIPSNAVLVGHSLENDMLALKWYHPAIIDTAGELKTE